MEEIHELADVSPKPNFEILFGESAADGIVLGWRVKRSIANRIKYRLFCWLLPFRIIRWDK